MTIVDEAALREAEAEQAKNALVIQPPGPGDDEDLSEEEVDEAPPKSAMDTLEWLVWPTMGLEQALEAGALRIESVDVDIVSEPADVGAIAWTLVVKLTSVEELRRLAVQAQPGQPDTQWIVGEADPPTVWRRAVDPFEPLRSIPGIAWRPGTVTIEHRPA